MAYAVIIYENQYSVFSLNFYSSHGHFACVFMFFIQSLWSPYVIRQTIIFLPCDFYLLSSFFFSSQNLSGRRLDVYHTSTHGVALVQI